MLYRYIVILKIMNLYEYILFFFEIFCKIIVKCFMFKQFDKLDDIDV